MMRLVDAVAIVAAILVIWLGLYAYAGDVAITPPLRTFAFAAELLSRASFWNHVGATMAAFAMALAISAVAGVALGLVLGMRRFAGEVAEPILSSLYTIPKVTLYPVMLLIFGLGMSAKVAFGVIHGIIPVMLFTMAAFAMALAISAVAGVALGLALGMRRFAGEVAEPILSSLYTIPKVTLYPLMLLIFGLGMSAKVAFGVIHGMIPVMLFTMAAVKNIQPVLLRTARVLRLSPTRTALSVLAPAVTPEIITGLRVGFSLTLLGVLIGEMFASQRGLGFLIIHGIEVNDVRMTTTVTLLVVVFAVAANGLMLALDRRAHHFA